MYEHFEYFKVMRNKIMENSQILIRYHWLRYKKNKRKLLMKKKEKQK